MNVEKELHKIVNEVKALAKAAGKFSGFCIGNTRKISDTGLYFSPIRRTNAMVAGSAIVYNVKQAENIARYVDGLVDYVLVDTEKKISPELYGEGNVGNVERTVRETVKRSKILTYKGNDITVDSIEFLIVFLLSTFPRGLSGKKATIIGAGNVGAKLALKLVERGMRVTLVRRDKQKLSTIVSALNYIKPKETIAEVYGSTDPLLACEGADLIVGLTPGTPVINSEMVKLASPDATLLDGGKGCFMLDAIQYAEDSNLPIYRADIRAGFEGHVNVALETERIVTQSLGRKKIVGIDAVSGGLLGRSNEVVVDNVNNPKSVFGLANGKGDFVRALDESQIKMIDSIRSYINGKGVVK